MEVATAGAAIRKTSTGKPYRFHVGIVLKESVSVPAFAKATFENPLNPANPFVVTQRIDSRGKVALIETPTFANRPENRLFTVTVELYGDASRKQKIDQLTQQFLPGLPSEQELRRAGLGHLVD